MAALRRLAESGVDVPALQRTPVIRDTERWLWDAFCHLSEKRWRIDGTPQPVPMTEILAYAVFQQIAAEEARDLLFYMVSCLDSVYMRHHWDEVAKRQERSK